MLHGLNKNEKLKLLHKKLTSIYKYGTIILRRVKQDEESNFDNELSVRPCGEHNPVRVQ
jgi:hypothetical protein